MAERAEREREQASRIVMSPVAEGRHVCGWTFLIMFSATCEATYRRWRAWRGGLPAGADTRPLLSSTLLSVCETRWVVPVCQ
jgi:hypothetical protein